MIREALMHDVPHLLPIAREFHAESRHRVFPFSEEKVTRIFTGCIGGPGGIAYVAEHGGETIGFAVGEICPHPMFDTLMAFEYGIYVLPAHRGRMHGFSLMRAYVQAARARGVSDINAGITTAISPERTARLYERIGMFPIGILLNTTR